VKSSRGGKIQIVAEPCGILSKERTRRAIFIRSTVRQIGSILLAEVVAQNSHRLVATALQ